MKEFLKKLGQRIKELRALKNLSQEELAGKANLSQKYLSEVERGAKNPSVGTIAKIACALEISLKEVFYFPLSSEEERLKDEIMVLLARQGLEDIKKALKVLQALFE